MFHLYVNLSHWMLRIPRNPVYVGQQIDRTLYSVAPEPNPVGVKQRVIGPIMMVCSWWDLGTHGIIFRKIRISTTTATSDVVKMGRRRCEVVKQGPCTANSNKKRPGQPQAGDPAYDRQLCHRRAPRHLLTLAVTVA